MSPRSRGRPPGRGRRPKPGRPATPRKPHPLADGSDDAFGSYGDETTDCWFDEPVPGDRRSWAIPPGHGIYLGMDLELLDPGDDDELMFLLEAVHEEDGDVPDSVGDVTAGEPVNPRLHVLMHQVVAKQLLADEPPETWRTAQRLAGLGYDWHDIMHMIAELVTHDVRAALSGRHLDPADYVRRLDQLPGDRPPPEALR